MWNTDIYANCISRPKRCRYFFAQTGGFYWKYEKKTYRQSRHLGNICIILTSPLDQKIPSAPHQFSELSLGAVLVLPTLIHSGLLRTALWLWHMADGGWLE